MRVHPRGRTGLDVGRALEILRFTEQTLDEAADLTFESEVRRRILRAADRIRSVIDGLEAQIVTEVTLDQAAPLPVRAERPPSRLSLSAS